MAIDNYTPEQIEEILQAFFEVAGTRQYIGARYVPIFGRGRGTSVDWDGGTAAYEPLSIVYWQGDTYTSRRYVPAGIDIQNTDYWVITGRYNAQVEQYRQEVLGFSSRIDGAYEAVDMLRNDVANDYVPFPDGIQHPKYGSAGQILGTLTDGTTEWVDPVVVTSEVASPLIDAWLDDHPEATTTVEDGAITTAKLANGAVTDAKLAQTGGVLSDVATIKALMNQRILALVNGIGDLDDILACDIPNHYNPENALPGYALSDVTPGLYFADARYALTEPIRVNPGKKIFSQGKVNGSNQQITSSVRLLTIFDVAGNATNPGSYSYANTGTDPVYAVFTLWYDHPSYTVTDLQINIVDATDATTVQTYHAYGIASERLDVLDTNLEGSTDANLEAELTNAEYLGTIARHNANLYNPTLITPGKTALDVSDARFAKSETYIVGPGQSIFTCARVNNGVMKFPTSCRARLVLDKYGNRYEYTEDMDAACKYKNETDDYQYVIFTLFYDHPSYSVTNLMIKIVDNDAEVVIGGYYPFHITVENDVPDYLASTVETGIESLNGLVTRPSLNFIWLTDSHLDPDIPSNYIAWDNTIRTMREVMRRCPIDFILHTGDFVDLNYYSGTLQNNADVYSTIYKSMRDMQEISDKLIVVSGNHDGRFANIFNNGIWYYNCGGGLNRDYVTGDVIANSLTYKDFPVQKVRVVTLALPDSGSNDSSSYWGFSGTQLKWLAEEALDTPDGYTVILAIHAAQTMTQGGDEMERKGDFEDLINAYQNHTTWSFTNWEATINVDYSSKTDTSVAFMLAGHAHGDYVVDVAEESLLGVTNGLPCKIVISDCAWYVTDVVGPDYAYVHNARNSGTETEILLNVCSYDMTNGILHVVRIGAGSSMNVTL